MLLLLLLLADDPICLMVSGAISRALFIHAYVHVPAFRDKRMREAVENMQ